jgi:SAM-dependent methyltransferase
MIHPIISLHYWFNSPPGRYLLAWEQERFDEAVADIFGYHGLQIGIPMLDGLRANRMPHQWLALGEEGIAMLPGARATTPPSTSAVPGPDPLRLLALLTDSVALPFADSSLDLILLPHTLEQSLDPHATLREVERVLVPEGRVVISGLNPVSLWALRQHRTRLCQRMGRGRLYLPDAGEFIGYGRLRDWLRLLNFEVESARFGCYRPAVCSSHWLERFAWMDRFGEQWWPILGAAYFLVAVKRVHGMRLLEPAWRTPPQRAAASVPVANRGAAGTPSHRTSLAPTTAPGTTDRKKV